MGESKYMNHQRVQELIDKIKLEYLSKGEIPYSASKVQKNTLAHSINGNGSVRAKIVFARSFPDTDYIIVPEFNKINVECAIIEKRKDGFTVIVSNYNSINLDIICKFTSFELYELTQVGDMELDLSNCLKYLPYFPNTPSLDDVFFYIGEDIYEYLESDLNDITNPKNSNLYELQNGTYVKTNDEEVISEKIYYSKELKYETNGLYQFDGNEWELKNIATESDIESLINSLENL